MEQIKLLHAIAGITVGLTGLLQILLRKGGKLHRIIGLTYFWAWLAVIVTGAAIGSALITMFGILGFYMALTGYRFGHQKSVKINQFDKAVIYTGLVFSIGTLAWGIYLALNGEATFGAVAAFFGIIFLLTTRKDLQEFVQGKPIRKLSGHPMQWYFEHFGRMYISYIAAMTAFTVIQEVFPITILNWILPTVVGTILITMSNRKYQQQFNIEK